ncbi:MAG: hypothetical protein KGI08_07900, partial [Thaumarchaeota archaeon]|nr:hypothetical protein [Nitrososphaerota archaeon]
MMTNAFAQNNTDQIPPNAIRTSDGGWITPLQTHTENGSKLTIHYETGTPVAGNYLPPGPPPMFDDIKNQTLLPPLEQFKTGTAASDVKCNDGLQLVFKAEDGSPACVKPEYTAKLVQRGWATQIIPSVSIKQSILANASNALHLLLSENSTVIGLGKTIGINIAVKNTLPANLTLNSQNNWPLEGLGLTPCTPAMPFGVVLLQGNYLQSNMTQAKHLGIYQNGTYMCPMLMYMSANSYAFEPSSDIATLDTGNGNFTKEMNFSLSIAGLYDKQGLEQFTPGAYTIVGGDEWGHIAIRHFTVANSTSLNVVDHILNIIPSCVSNIQDQYAIAGPPGAPLCPVMNFQSSAQILNSTGFYGIYNYTKFPGTQNFVLEPGHNGTIVYQISIDSIYNWGDTLHSNEINVTNGLSFMHDAGMNNHPGLYVSVHPTSETMSKNSSAFVT